VSEHYRTLREAAGFYLSVNKVRLYLLVADHPQNGGKAKFFEAFGFSLSDPLALADSLAEHPKPETIVAEPVSPEGDIKLIFEGSIRAPDGRAPNVRTVWSVESQTVVNFVTAIPLTKRPRPSIW
jgi:hypothetical protein